MEKIDKVILQRDFYLWNLYENVYNSSELNEKEKNMFNHIWEDATDFVFHNYSQPQNVGVKYVTEKYKLSEEAANQIIVSLLYLLK